MLFSLIIFTFVTNIASHVVYTTPHLVKQHNYPVQTHTVETKDGYFLKIFRIPNSPRSPKQQGHKPVFLLQHGLGSCSDIFLLNGPKNGLPFLLADAGYDVWLGNARGNRYCRRHRSISPDDERFWRFSWHEIGAIDMPTMIDYILRNTHQSSLHYVGHSQGGTTFLVLLSLQPNYNRMIKTSHLLAPASWMTGLYVPAAVRFFIESYPDLEFVPNIRTFAVTRAYLCDVAPNWCSLFYFNFVSDYSPHMNTTLLPLLLGTHPAGGSSRQPLHYIQLRESGQFRQYEYGVEQNLKIYGQPEPPEYPLYHVNPLSKVNIFYSPDDGTIAVQDIKILANNLRNRQVYKVNIDGWLHTDFLLAWKVKKVINLRILRNANEFEQNNSKILK